MFMEDTFIAEDALGKNQSVSLFAIFDGHGGTSNLKQVLMFLFLQHGTFLSSFKSIRTLKNINT